MATTAGPFQLGDHYRKLHSIATSQPLNIDLVEGEYVVGVLEPGKDESTCRIDQFLFFKVKAVGSLGQVPEISRDEHAIRHLFSTKNVPGRSLFSNTTLL